MQIQTSQNKLQPINGPTAAALGNFDGLHIAHMEIINKAISYAKEHDMLSLVYTFQKNSKNIVSGAQIAKTITTQEEKEFLLKKTPLDILYLEEFTPELMQMSPEEFVVYLKNVFHVAFISVGYNYRFGYRAEGDAALLQKLCDKYQMTLCVTKPVYWQGELVCSSRIRAAIEQGEMEAVRAMLGRPYFVRGTVKHGNRIGRQMGFPTLNTPVAPGAAVPKFGVYITKTYIDGVSYRSITNVGIKPTVGTNELTIETYIIDFNENLYGQDIEVEFYQWTRGEKKFPSFDLLREQISRDVEKSRSYPMD